MVAAQPGPSRRCCAMLISLGRRLERKCRAGCGIHCRLNYVVQLNDLVTYVSISMMALKYVTKTASNLFLRTCVMPTREKVVRGHEVLTNDKLRHCMIRNNVLSINGNSSKFVSVWGYTYVH